MQEREEERRQEIIQLRERIKELEKWLDLNDKNYEMLALKNKTNKDNEFLKFKEK